MLKDVKWIYLTQDMDRMHAFSTCNELEGSIKCKEFLN